MIVILKINTHYFRFENRDLNDYNVFEVKDWIRQILSGLEYLHTHEPAIFHQNFGCKNILVKDGIAKLCVRINNFMEYESFDFGIENLYPYLFISPDIILGKIRGPPDEVWSFGLTIIEMVTKKTPYSHCTGFSSFIRTVKLKSTPKELEDIVNNDLKEFLKLCFVDINERPIICDLLEHSFLKYKKQKNARFISTQ